METGSNGSEKVSLENQILRLARQYPGKLTQEKISEELRHLPPDTLLALLTRLISEMKLVVAKNQNSELVFLEPSPEQRAKADKLKGLNTEENLIYQLISAQGNRGIWTRDLKLRSNLQQPQVSKILKVLETRQLVKWVKSVVSKNRKLYMLAELEPHQDITGDIWYSPDQEIDSEFINILQVQCYKTICEKMFASVEDITAAVKKTGIFKVEVRVENVQSILDTLIYDGKIECIPDPRVPALLSDNNNSGMLFKPTNLAVIENGFTSNPCGVCPVFEQCSDSGPITPITCVYYQKWLSF